MLQICLITKKPLVEKDKLWRITNCAFLVVSTTLAAFIHSNGFLWGIRWETKKYFLYAVLDWTAKTLEECIRASILPGTAIFSDIWNNKELKKKKNGKSYKHFTINHSSNFVDPVHGAHTQTIELMLAKAKRRNIK